MVEVHTPFLATPADKGARLTTMGCLSCGARVGVQGRGRKGTAGFQGRVWAGVGGLFPALILTIIYVVPRKTPHQSKWQMPTTGMRQPTMQHGKRCRAVSSPNGAQLNKLRALPVTARYSIFIRNLQVVQ